jgi:hypothetical protein
MSMTAKPLATSAYAASSETTIYTSPTGTRTILDKFTLYNTDTAPITYTVKLVPVGGTAAANHTIVVKTVAPGETYTLPEVIGHVLESGGFVSEQASAANKLVRRLSGREVSS